MKCTFTLVFAVLALGVAVFAEDTVATTEDGRTVVLHDDGTWEFADALQEPTGSEGESASTFRDVSWGMSRAEVIVAEGADPVHEDEDTVFYTDTVAGLDALVVYDFVGDTLVSAGYLITETHTNRNDHIDDYEKLKRLLSSKYGEPEVDRVHWGNDLYQDDPDQYGFAVSLGHLTYISQWHTPTTELSLVLTGTNYEISHGLTYTSIAHKEMKEAADEAEAMGGL